MTSESLVPLTSSLLCVEKLTSLSVCSYLSRLQQGSEPMYLSFSPICSSLAVSVPYSGVVTTEQGMTETWSVLALSLRSLNKPGTIMFTTVFPAYRFVQVSQFVNLVAF